MIETEVFNLIASMGEILLKNGAEIFRVDETMKRVAKCYGIESFNSYTLANGIFASAVLNNKRYTAKIQFVPIYPIRLCIIDAVNQLSREIVENNCTPEEAYKRLNEIKNMKLTSNAKQIIAAGIGSGCFCSMFGGSLVDSLISFILGSILYLFVLKGADKITNSKIMRTIMSSAIVTFLAALFNLLKIGNIDLMIIGSIFPLIPGVPLTNSVRCFLEDDYLTGIIRLVDAVLVTMCIAAGVFMTLKFVSYFVGGSVL